MVTSCPRCKMALPPESESCPRCGAAIDAPGRAASLARVLSVGLALTLLLVGLVVFRTLQTMEAPAPAAAPPSAGQRDAPLPSAGEPAATSLPAEAPPSEPAGDDARSSAAGPEVDTIAGWIADLDDDSGGRAWQAARALGESGDPRAADALLLRLRNREFGKVSGAAAFFASLDDPSLEPLLLDLLHESKDLAVAQAYLESGKRSLADAGREWAASVGFTWDGETWQQ